MTHLKQVILFSLNIMLYSAIVNTDTGIISQFTHQNGNDWAGPLLTGLFFLGSGLSSTRNFYIGKFQYRYCVFVGSLGSLFYIALGLVFLKLQYTTMSLVMVLIAGFGGGCLVSVFYNSIYNYLNLLSHEDHQETKYFCISIGIVNCCNLFGSLISSGLIAQLQQFEYVLVLACLIFIISCFFLFFKHPDTKKQSLLESDANPNANIQKNRNIEDDKIQQTLQAKQEIFDEQHIPIDSFHQEQIKPYYLFLLYGITGMIIAYILTGFSIIVYNTFEGMEDKKLNQLTFILFIFQGIGQIIGGIAVISYSYYRDRVEKKQNTKSLSNLSPQNIFKIILTTFILAVAIVFLASLLRSQYLMGFGIFLVGATDCTAVSMGLTISGRWRKKGVSAYNFGQCIIVFLSNCFMAFVGVVAISIFSIGYSILAGINLYLYNNKYKKFLDEQENNRQ